MYSTAAASDKWFGLPRLFRYLVDSLNKNYRYEKTCTGADRYVRLHFK